MDGTATRRIFAFELGWPRRGPKLFRFTLCNSQKSYSRARDAGTQLKKPAPFGAGFSFFCSTFPRLTPQNLQPSADESSGEEAMPAILPSIIAEVQRARQSESRATSRARCATVPSIACTKPSGSPRPTSAGSRCSRRSSAGLAVAAGSTGRAIDASGLLNRRVGPAPFIWRRYGM